MLRAWFYALWLAIRDSFLVSALDFQIIFGIFWLVLVTAKHVWKFLKKIVSKLDDLLL